MCIEGSHAIFQEGDKQGLKKPMCEVYDVERLDEFGQNCLHVACSENDVDAATFLIGQGANVNAMESRGGSLEWMTPIHIAVLRNSMDLVNMLISAGADVNVVTGGHSGGSTCLHLVRSSNMARVLISAGANINKIAVADGMTPLMHAIETSMMDVARVLVKAGADVNVHTKYGTTLLESVKSSAKCNHWISKVSTLLVKAGAS